MYECELVERRPSAGPTAQKPGRVDRVREDETGDGPQEQPQRAERAAEHRENEEHREATPGNEKERGPDTTGGSSYDSETVIVPNQPPGVT